MNSSQEENFKLMLQYKPCYEQDHKDRRKGSIPQKTPTVFKTQNNIITLNLRFPSWYISVDVFQDQPKNEPFIRDINSTLLTYKQQCYIRHRLEAYVRYSFSTEKMTSQALFCSHFSGSRTRPPAAICWFKLATIECRGECSFQSIFQLQSDKLSIVSSWFKRAMVLYMPAATTVAKLYSTGFSCWREF